jgi:zinc protease
MRTMFDPQVLPTSKTVQRFLLPDGTTLLIKADPSSRSVVIQGTIFVDGIESQSYPLGTAKFMAECLTRGTKAHTAAELYEKAESLGASFSFDGGIHTIRLDAKCLSEDVSTLIALLSDCLQNSIFPQDEIEHVRGQFLSDLEEYEYDTRYLADRSFRSLAYPANHAYNAPADGTRESILAIDRDDLVGLYEEVVRVGGVATDSIATDRAATGGMTVVIVGAVDSDSMVGLISEQWGSGGSKRARGSHVEVDIPLRSEPVSEHVVVPGKTQVDLLWGGVGPRRRDDDFVAAALANAVLGGFGLMGRLGRHIREEEGLAYYVSSALVAGIERGPWICTAGVAPNQFQAVLEIIKREVDVLCSTPVPFGELDDCKSALVGSLLLRLESNEGIAGSIAEVDIHQLGADYLAEYENQINAIEPPDVMAAAARYLPVANRILASAGPVLP